MDNLGIARIFTDIGDLLEIKSANPFKVRAYRNAADIVGHMAERIADLTDADLRELPGIGKDLTAKSIQGFKPRDRKYRPAEQGFRRRSA